MKKFKSSILSLLTISLFIGNSYSQTLNQPANWPNASWSVGGDNYSPANVLNDPRTDANFTFDDDGEGDGSFNDKVWAQSPVIDLTPAFNAGEMGVEISGAYIFESSSGGDVLRIQYYDADATIWVNLLTAASIPGAIFPAYPNCVTTTDYTTPILDISGFTPNQLLGFRYRMFYDDKGGWEYGFCLDSPTLVSVPPACPKPTALTSANETNTTANLGWTEAGGATAWDIEVVASGTTPSGTPTDPGVTTNPFAKTGLTASTSYDFYVRSDCGGGDLSSWVGPFTFSTTGSTPTCNDPSAGTSSNETNTTAQLAWTENGTANSYNIEIVLKDATATGTATDFGVENPFTATDLTAATTYDYYVQADCSSSLTSEWVGPFTFTTTSTTPTPTCDAPSNIGTNSISDNQVDIKWTENGTATTWE
ncbi:MAG: hypothetical protein ACI9XP_000788, partial [Lentimonas sp.]